MVGFYEYLVSFAVAFVVAFMFTPIAKRIAHKVGAIDVPKDERRIHTKPIPRMGGLAIYCGFLVSIFITVLSTVLGVLRGIEPVFQVDLKLLGFLGGSVIIVALGAIDDVRPLRAKLKLLIQIVAAFIVVVTGTRIENFTNPFSEIGVTQFPYYLSVIITVFWIVGVTNAINLLDGLDGLAAGVSSIASLSMMFIMILSPDLSAVTAAIIMAALAGSTLGFLPYNFNPAKIFMGDTGATFLGFTLAVVSTMGTYKSYTAIALMLPILVLGLPIFDTLFAITRRLMSGKPIMEADRGHLHHRLIDMGLSHRQSVAIMYVVSAVLGLSAIVLAESGVIRAVILVAAVAVFVIAGTRYMSTIDETAVAQVDTTGAQIDEAKLDSAFIEMADEVQPSYTDFKQISILEDEARKNNDEQ